MTKHKILSVGGKHLAGGGGSGGRGREVGEGSGGGKGREEGIGYPHVHTLTEEFRALLY